jgi:hypothetical protein
LETAKHWPVNFFELLMAERKMLKFYAEYHPTNLSTRFQDEGYDGSGTPSAIGSNRSRDGGLELPLLEQGQLLSREEILSRHCNTESSEEGRKPTQVDQHFMNGSESVKEGQRRAG